MDGFEKQVVKVHGVVLEQLGLVCLEDVGDPFTVWILGTKKIFLRVDHVVFGPVIFFAQNVARGELLGVDSHALHDLLDDALLIVFVEDREVACKSLAYRFQSLDVAAQDAHAERMERGDERLGERRVTEQPVDALGHLAGRLVSEGDSENRVRRDVFLENEPRDSVRDDASLARSGAGKDQEGSLGGFYRCALFGIQVVEELLQGVESSFDSGGNVF